MFVPQQKASRRALNNTSTLFSGTVLNKKLHQNLPKLIGTSLTCGGMKCFAKVESWTQLSVALL